MLIPKLKTVALFLITGFLIFASMQVAATTPTLEEQQLQFRQAQSKNDPVLQAQILRKMLDNGYKTIERYKQLGDIYFYLKNDKEALDTFREQANWAQTPETWENLSDLLLWKKQEKEGLAALETALKLAPNNQEIKAKLASKYEYYKKIDEAESLFTELYKRNDKSMESGQQLIAFYLRNGLVVRAKEIMDELISKDPNLADSKELKVLNVKINTWLSKPEEAFKALQKLEVKSIPESDLPYSFDLALFGGDPLLAEEILKRMEEAGKDVWNEHLKLKKALGVPKDTRQLIEHQISIKGETPELLYDLYETYRAERDSKNEIKILEKIIQKDPSNPTWYNLLMTDFIYYQMLNQGIGLFEDLAKNNPDLQLTKLNLSKLYLANQQYDAFFETIAQVTDEAFGNQVLDLKTNAAYQLNDKEKIIEILQQKLEQTKNQAPEEIGTSEKTNIVVTEDVYLDILTELQYLATTTGKTDLSREYGIQAYQTMRTRYDKYPTNSRLRMLLRLGEDFANPEERARDFAEAKEILSDTSFYLEYYRYLMQEGKYQEAEPVLTQLLASSRTIEDAVQTAEHTFGFVSYNLSKKLFSDIIAQDPNYSMGLKRLGQIGLYTDNYQEAIFYMKKYLQVNPYDPEAIFNLAEALYFNHQPSDAFDQFEHVISLLDYPNQDSYETLLSAISHLRLGNYEKALVLLQSANKKDPEDLSIKLNILETLVLLEKWSESLALIEKENLDDEQKKEKAMELVFKADINTAATKEDSELKANLEYQELKAIVDLQLAIRVSIIKHLCLQGLGRDKEDQALLRQLALKHPGNQEIMQTIGYYYQERGEDVKAMDFLARARVLPPFDPVISQSYRELLHTYSTNAGAQYSQASKTNNGQLEYQQQSVRLFGKYMLNQLDSVNVEINSFTSARSAIETKSSIVETNLSTGEATRSESTATSTSDSVSNSAYDISYRATIGYNFDNSISHKYEAHLWFFDFTGYQIKYLAKFPRLSLNLQLNLFSDLPVFDDFDSVKSKTADTGYGVDAIFTWKSMNQVYYFTYQGHNYKYGNENFSGSPSQTLLSIGVSQSLLTYPSNLELGLTYLSNSASGEVEEYDPETNTRVYKHQYLPYTQIQVDSRFQHYWSEFLLSGVSIGYTTGEYQEMSTANKTSSSQSFTINSVNVDLSYRKDGWSFSGYLNYQQENDQAKTETTTSNGVRIENTAEIKAVTTTSFGVTLNYVF